MISNEQIKYKPNRQLVLENSPDSTVTNILVYEGDKLVGGVFTAHEIPIASVCAIPKNVDMYAPNQYILLKDGRVCRSPNDVLKGYAPPLPLTILSRLGYWKEVDVI